MKTSFGFMLLVVIVGMVGCASKTPPTIQVPAAVGKKTVAVMAVDKRAASAQKPVSPDHLGRVGAAFGTPFTLTTENQAPVSQNLAHQLTKGFRAGGWRTARASSAIGGSGSEAIRALQGQDADRLVIVTLNDWQSDTLASTTFHFDLELSILNSRGQVLAVEHLRGRQNLGYPKFGRLGETIRQAMDEESSRIFTTALQKPSLVAALR